jgi:hypothetical protein
MSIFVEDGTGRGYKLGVTEENQGLVQAEIHELQHHISWNNGQAYQIWGTETAIAAATQTILWVRNDSTTQNFIVSYMRLQVAGESGGTALTSAENYFQLGFGRTYGSGGTEVTPVNMNQASGNVASLTAYHESPTMAGTFTEFDRWYPGSDSMQVYNKHGSMILGLNDTIEIRLVSDHTAGHAYARITGMFRDA